MKKTILYICIFICSIVVNAQEKKLENSVLWKIEHKDLAEPSYLLGTIHIMCESDFSIPEKVLKAFHKTKSLVLETDLSDTAALQKMQQSMMSGNKLSETLSKEKQHYLDSLLKKELNISLEMVNSYSLTTIYTLLIQQSAACSSKKMYEFELISMAKKEQKNIGGLEALDAQMNFFEKAYPEAFLWQQIELFHVYKKEFAKMVKSYKKEDITQLFLGLKDERFFNANAEKWLLTHRNKNWVKQMPAMMQKESTLFGVGAAHLVGENGVIHLLRKQGYKVTPVFK